LTHVYETAEHAACTDTPGGAADVVVIGAGAAGAVATKRLAEAGFDVVCLEQGVWPDYSTSRVADDLLELAAGKEWAWSPNQRQGVADYPVEDSESDVGVLMWNGVGGSTVLYGGIWMRLMPSDFRVRSLDGVGDDWPVTYDDLVPYWERIEEDFAVSGLPGDPAFPRLDRYPLPGAPIGRAGRRLARAHNELGWHWWPGSNAIATRPYRDMGPCVQRAACMWGCVNRAKGSTDITHWPAAIERGARLVCGARVARIETDARGRATGVLYVDASGSEHRQEGDVVILAANGIGTPRLLLLSDSPSHPDGLANSSGLVGKRLMLHPFTTVVGVFEEDLQTTQGVFGQLIYSLEFYETDPTRDFVRGAKWNLLATGGPLSMIRPFPWGNDQVWGERFHEKVAQRLGHAASWGIVAEDLPEERNRVELDPGLTDSNGFPAPKVVYSTSENTQRLLAFNVARARESLEAAGAVDVIEAPQIRETGWHLLGTAKMGSDPATSVVDEWGRAHDVPNLYILDGSVWPTSSGTNPTPTIAAFSLRCVEQLIRTRSLQVTA
jgi:choline dehydrogenase-like flavoprotein